MDDRQRVHYDKMRDMMDTLGARHIRSERLREGDDLHWFMLIGGAVVIAQVFPGGDGFEVYDQVPAITIDGTREYLANLSKPKVSA